MKIIISKDLARLTTNVYIVEKRGRETHVMDSAGCFKPCTTGAIMEPTYTLPHDAELVIENSHTENSLNKSLIIEKDKHTEDLMKVIGMITGNKNV